jgi:hypothetical protein
MVKHEGLVFAAMDGLQPASHLVDIIQMCAL